MVVVTVEIWPFGDESQKQHLGTVNISNNGTGDSRTGNYSVVLLRPTKDGVSIGSGTTVRGHERASGWLPLVKKAFGKL